MLVRSLLVWSSLLLAGLPASAQEVEDVYARILGHALGGDGAHRKLSHLCDRIGPRLSGSSRYDQAAVWAVEELRRDGMDRVWTEGVKVPHWVRGVERGAIVAPVEHPMAITALGMSDPTPPEGISAEVIEVASIEELKAAGDAVRGKIVLYNKPVFPDGGEDRGYGSAVGLRLRGAVEAAKLGGVGSLIRSLGTASFRLTHTGMMSYEAGVPRIPAAAISREDADLIHRLLEAGERVHVRFTLGCRNLPEVIQPNVVADLTGRERPEEIVLVGAHLDSWDLGTGATDDGAGVATVMEVARLLGSLGLRPRRTIRVVLFANEENGLRGGRAYAETHREEAQHHVAAIEADSGGTRPTGFGVSAGPGAVNAVRRIAAALKAIDAAEVQEGGGGADISPLASLGVPQLGLRNDTARYFDFHHNQADTLDKVDARDLAKNVAALAVLAYGLADASEPLPRLPPKSAPEEASPRPEPKGPAPEGRLSR